MVSMLGPSYTAGNDLCIPKYANVEQNLQQLAAFQPQKNDYILCSYPKSGTHWVTEILSMLVSGEDEYSCGPIKNLESGNYSDRAPYRVLHTHLPYDMLPDSIIQSKIIYVIREPRDQIVSLYHHHQGLKWSPSMSFQEFFQSIMDNPHKVEYGNWFRNAYQWWLRFRYSDNVLFVFYEDLIADLHREIKRIAEFHDLTHLSADFISKVAEKTKFSQMKNKPVGAWFSHWHKDTFSIYRKGHIGNWQRFFTPEMNDEFQQFCSQMAKSCQYPLNYHRPRDHIYANVICNHSDSTEVLEPRKQEVAMAH